MEVYTFSARIEWVLCGQAFLKFSRRVCQEMNFWLQTQRLNTQTIALLRDGMNWKDEGAYHDGDRSKGIRFSEFYPRNVKIFWYISNSFSLFCRNTSPTPARIEPSATPAATLFDSLLWTMFSCFLGANYTNNYPILEDFFRFWAFVLILIT